MILLRLLFEALLACAAAVAAAFGEGTAEATSCSDAGAGGVAASGCGGVAASADCAAEAVASPAAVVVAVGNEEREEAAVAVGTLLCGGLVGAEAVVDYVILFVDAALHLRFAAASEERECGRGKEWSGDLG
jgi:hypothetical protein